MQTSQSYMLTINDLITMSGGVICGADAEIAILDGSVEIDRLKLSGKVGPGGPGFRRSYEGKPGLTAELVSGCCKISFREAVSSGLNSEV
jgi:hypothetical protein